MTSGGFNTAVSKGFGSLSAFLYQSGLKSSLIFNEDSHSSAGKLKFNLIVTSFSPLGVKRFHNFAAVISSSRLNLLIILPIITSAY